MLFKVATVDLPLKFSKLFGTFKTVEEDCCSLELLQFSKSAEDVCFCSEILGPSFIKFSGISRLFAFKMLLNCKM